MHARWSTRNALLGIAMLTSAACAGGGGTRGGAPPSGSVPAPDPALATSSGRVPRQPDAVALYRRMGLLAEAGETPFVGSLSFFAGPSDDSTSILVAVSLANRALRFRSEGDRWRAVYDVAINALTENVLLRYESLHARQSRLESSTRDDARDLQGTLATLQQATLTLKREMERVLASATTAPSAPVAPVAPVAPGAPVIDSYKYVGFEDRFRGSREDIRARIQAYVPLFAGHADVLDVGCGRGEFLDLMREAGIRARGLDNNHEMVEACRARGLDVAEGDLVAYLSELPDASLGGLIAVQVVEHLEPSYLMRALDVAYHKLRPGSLIVLETINVASWYAFFSSYIRDLTHQRPIHPETLQYLLTASGFQRARIEFSAPLRDMDKLQPLAPPRPEDPPALVDLITTFNANVNVLNSLLFAFQDYAAIAERL